MAEKNVTVTEEGNITTETYTVKKNFWEAYSKPIIVVGSLIILAIAGFYGYKKFIKEPNEKKAEAAIFPAEGLFDKMAQQGFNKDSVNIVLNGGQLENTKVTGLLSIISKYSGTPAANRANYMAGAAYLQTGEFAKAVTYLNKFDDNGAYQFDIKRNIMLGHAYAEQDKKEDALKAFKKAASINEKDDAFTADALIVAAAYAESIGNTKEAIELYTKVRDNYPDFPAVQNGDVDKNLAKVGVLK